MHDFAFFVHIFSHVFINYLHKFCRKKTNVLFRQNTKNRQMSFFCGYLFGRNVQIEPGSISNILSKKSTDGKITKEFQPYLYNIWNLHAISPKRPIGEFEPVVEHSVLPLVKKELWGHHRYYTGSAKTGNSDNKNISLNLFCRMQIKLNSYIWFNWTQYG